MPSISPLPLLLQQIFSRFQVQEVVGDLSGNVLRGRMVDVLGDLLIASNLALNRIEEVDDLKVRVAKLEEELIAKLCHDDDSIYNFVFVDEQTFLHVYLYKYLSSV